jgi:hypothetical protein
VTLEAIADALTTPQADCPLSRCFWHLEQLEPGIVLETLRLGYSHCSDVKFLYDLRCQTLTTPRPVISGESFELAKVARMLLGVPLQLCPSTQATIAWQQQLDIEMTQLKVEEIKDDALYRAEKLKAKITKLERDRQDHTLVIDRLNAVLAKKENQLRESKLSEQRMMENYLCHERELETLLKTNNVDEFVHKRVVSTLCVQDFWNIFSCRVRRSHEILSEDYSSTANYYPNQQRQTKESDTSIMVFAQLILMFLTRVESVESDAETAKAVEAAPRCVVCGISEPKQLLLRPCAFEGCKTRECENCFYSLVEPNRCSTCRKSIIKCKTCSAIRLCFTAERVWCSSCDTTYWP